MQHQGTRITPGGDSLAKQPAKTQNNKNKTIKSIKIQKLGEKNILGKKYCAIEIPRRVVD
ncbi:hypothetical protein CWE08_00505 [Aliidiomarina iranensis]|uniref:Uncharacterized protein n=1 Tax=Aliidiomarina iranensis TaxID=1434071 RepID=A0A432W1R4_9GAMM|nr:hypothetical protein [Aliidiomarina iranensis]RUO23170.1 hypothetical protein CWE08_00505 [Aliidiomarina iranensis]